jgi:prevent-host-death family protein
MEMTMDSFTIPEAKERLEELIERAKRGEDVRISDPVRGAFRLSSITAVPTFTPLAKDRVPGRLKGKLQVPARLMEPMTDEELRDWYGDDA